MVVLAKAPGLIKRGLIAVAAFWFAIQLSWSVVGKRWYSVTWRLLVALGLFGLGFVMIFFTAFGA